MGKKRCSEYYKKPSFYETLFFKCSLGVLVFLILFLSASALLHRDIAQADFDLGEYHQTFYNTSYIQLNLSNNNGTYTSNIFDLRSNVSLQNLSWTFQRIQCPEGMVYINKLNGYCIDKYEASVWNADGTWNLTSNTSAWASATWSATAIAAGAYANSTPNVYPWVFINQTDARIACSRAGKHLCTDSEWLGAANIRGQYYNLPTGANSANVLPSGASDSSACVTYEAADCDWADSPNGGDACMTGSHVSCVSAEGVYDMVGNVWEWTNETVDVTNPEGSVGYKYANSSGGWQNTTGVETAIYGNDGVYFPLSVGGRAVARGGTWDNGAIAGPFSANLNYAPSVTGYGIGFRCCSS